MGVDLGELVTRRKISFQDLAGKSIAIDCFNALYQFLSTIRGVDGRPLMDSKGRITSHLSGLFYRTVNLIEYGVLPVYVFDGEPPKPKRVEVERRVRHRKEAEAKYMQALQEGRVEDARRYAQASAQVLDYMVADSQQLLSLMGVPWVQAPSEGEAQAAYMASRGDVWAAASQDYDALLFGAPKLVRNITITGRRKLPRRNLYVEVEPEVVELKNVLEELGIDRIQLVTLGILVGTDYNPEGFTGIGPKTALNLVKKYGSINEISTQLKDKAEVSDLEELLKLFLEPKITNSYKLKWGEPDVEGIIAFLCSEHNFSSERVDKAVKKIAKPLKEKKSTLERWF